MKFFACILSLYILLLSIVPCVDAAKENALKKIEFSTATTANQPNDIDQCSPFCTCNCCVSPIVFQNQHIQFTCFYYTQNHPAEYSFNYLSSGSTSIWQPPQIS